MSNVVLPGSCPGPTPGGGNDFEFTYQAGPTTIGSNTYTSLTNFQVFSRDVVVQETVAPEPGSLDVVGIALIVMAMARARRRA